MHSVIHSIYEILVCIFLALVQLFQLNWRPLLWSYSLQFLLAALFLRVEVGFNVMKLIGDEVAKFVFFAFDGATVAYGDPFIIFHPFFMMVSQFWQFISY